MTSAYRDVPETAAILFYRETTSATRVASYRASVRLILNRDHDVTQSSGDKIGVVKINIYVSVCEIRPIASPLFHFFFLLRLFPAMCGSRLANKSKRNRPASRSTNTKRVFCSRLPIAYALLPPVNDFRVRVRPTHSSRFLSSERTVSTRHRPRNQVESSIDLTLLSSVRSFHSTFRALRR